MIPTIRLTISPCDGHVAAGDTLHVTIRLDDAGSGGAYHLAIHGLPETWYTLDRAAVALDPGAHAEIDLMIRPPASRGRRADDYEVVVEARAEDASAVLASATLPLSVGPLDGVGVDVWPACETGATAAFGATAFNGLEWDASVELVVEAPAELEVRVDPPGYAVVPAGGALPFTVTVTPADVRAGVGPYDLAVYGVRPGGDRAVAATRARVVRFVYRPPLLSGAFVRPFPTRFVLVAGPLLLLLVLGIVAASGATRTSLRASPAVTPVARAALGSDGAAVPRDVRPVSATPGGGITRFSAAPDPSGGVVVVWSAPHALVVLLDGQRVARSGQQTLRLAHPATLVLTAIVSDGVVTRRLRVIPAPAIVSARRTQRPQRQRVVPAAPLPSPSSVPAASPSPASSPTMEPRATRVAIAGSAAHRGTPPTDTPVSTALARPSVASGRQSSARQHHAPRRHGHATPAARATSTPRPATVRRRRLPASASQEHARSHRRPVRPVRPVRPAAPTRTPIMTRTPIVGTALPVRLTQPTATPDVQARPTATPATLPRSTVTPRALPQATATPGVHVRATPTARAHVRATATARPRRVIHVTATPQPSATAATATRIAVRTQARPTTTPTPTRRPHRVARATPTRTRSTRPSATPTAVSSGVPTRTPTARPDPTRTTPPVAAPEPTGTAPAPRPTPTSTTIPEPEARPSPTSAPALASPTAPASPTPTSTPPAAGTGPTATPVPTPSAEPAPTATPLEAVTPVSTATPTETTALNATPTPTPSPSASATMTPTLTPPDTPAPIPTATVTPADTPTVAPTATPRHHRRRG